MQVDIPHGLFGVSLIWDFLDFYQHPILSNEYAHDYISITTYFSCFSCYFRTVFLYIIPIIQLFAVPYIFTTTWRDDPTQQAFFVQMGWSQTP